MIPWMSKSDKVVFLAFMAYASKHRLSCKTCNRMHQNALFRMEKVTNLLSPLPRPLPHPHLGGGYPLPRPTPIDAPSASRFSCPLTVLSAPLRDLGWRRP